MLVHTRSHTLFVRARVYAQDADFTVLPFLQPMSTTVYVYPSAWNTRMEMCHTCRWECDSCSKAWALRRFIYCFNYAVCFICMYFVRNDEIKTVNSNCISTPRSGSKGQLPAPPAGIRALLPRALGRLRTTQDGPEPTAKPRRWVRLLEKKHTFVLV